jgi:hypothetical protein
MSTMKYSIYSRRNKDLTYGGGIISCSKICLKLAAWLHVVAVLLHLAVFRFQLSSHLSLSADHLGSTCEYVAEAHGRLRPVHDRYQPVQSVRSVRSLTHSRIVTCYP